MSISDAEPNVSLERFDAFIFDLDGVITQTARVHAVAWKKMFDEYLAKRTPQAPPFDIESDYLRYVDGKPRYDGVRSFLQSRDIAAEALRLGREQYRLAGRTFTELQGDIDAEATERRNLIDARFNFLEALVNLEEVTGRALSEAEER